jgi:SAM-dependent methyltransferase
MAKAKHNNRNIAPDRDLLLWWEDFYLPIFEYALTEMGDLRGKRVLEIGCGTGGTAVMLAKRGASVVGIDLLDFRLADARKRAAEHGVSDVVEFALMNGMNLAFDANTFDFIISKSVLVFTDHSRISGECYRVLRPGGRAIFIENMRNHPGVRLYRKFFIRYASKLHYFSMADIERMAQYFDGMQHREFHLSAIGALVWQNLISAPKLYQTTLKGLHRLDEHLLKWFQVLRRFCWVTAMICDKKP